MKLTDCIISPATLGDKLLLIDVRPAYLYVDGKPTETVSAYRYIVAMPSKKMEKISVKIEGDKLMDVPEVPIEVRFDKLRLFLYWMNDGRYHVGACAEGIHPVNKG